MPLEDTGALLEDGLIWDPRLLLDGRLLQLLHGELRERMGPTEARSALLCAGFVQGYRDGRRAERGVGRSSASLLPITVEMDTQRQFVIGGWSRLEADAVVASGIAVGEPACALSTGYVSGWLSALGGEDVLATEVSCAARGARACRFEARPADRCTARDAPSTVRAALEALPFTALRAEVERQERPSAETLAFTSDTAAVHVWGPVMVVPYSGDDTARTVEAVVRDSTDEAISVVVIDVAGAILDQGFAASAIEQTVETIHARGAEAVIAGASARARRLLVRLACEPCSIHDELPAAIAAAFRIAESRRCSA